MCDHPGARLSKNAICDAEAKNAGKCPSLDVGGIRKCLEGDFSSYRNFVGNVVVRNQFERDELVVLSSQPIVPRHIIVVWWTNLMIGK
jgi:hypothetical protein